MEIMGKEFWPVDFFRRCPRSLADGRLLVERHEICDDWTRLKNQWILIENGTTTTFRFEITIYSGQA